MKFLVVGFSEITLAIFTRENAFFATSQEDSWWYHHDKFV